MTDVRAPAVMCQVTEDRLLAACIVRPEIFAYLEDFGVDHFAQLPHRAVWAAMRRLEHAGEPLTVLTIADDIAMHDIETGSHVANIVDVVWLANLVLDTGSYTHEILFDHDVWWLRELESRRRTLCTVA